MLFFSLLADTQPITRILQDRSLNTPPHKALVQPFGIVVEGIDPNNPEQKKYRLFDWQEGWRLPNNYIFYMLCTDPAFPCSTLMKNEGAGSQRIHFLSSSTAQRFFEILHQMFPNIGFTVKWRNVKHSFGLPLSEPELDPYSVSPVTIPEDPVRVSTSFSDQTPNTLPTGRISLNDIALERQSNESQESNNSNFVVHFP